MVGMYPQWKTVCKGSGERRHIANVSGASFMWGRELCSPCGVGVRQRQWKGRQNTRTVSEDLGWEM